jgi:diguanylate cyclase (GGDEF)-like protein
VNFAIDAESCVACLACVRVCPTEAIAVAGDGPLQLHIIDEACIRCGQCLPACPHGAVQVNGEIGRGLAIATAGDGVLILSLEAVAHFYPATPEQLINACYAAGFRAVTQGVVGDELVATEYLKLWQEEPWGTMIRSTDPVVVETIKAQYPELIPYLAPVVTPPVAEARYLRTLYGRELQIVYAGICPPASSGDLDAAITFGDLDQIFRMRGISVLAQPNFFARVPEERRRHVSMSGGLPLALLEESRYTSRRFRKVRGLEALKAIARAVAVDRLDLGFVDILSTEGLLAHPLSGPQEELYWRRALLASTEPPRSRRPVVDSAVVASVGATFDIRPHELRTDTEAVQAVLDRIGLGPNGRPWDCQACGFESCYRFAQAAAVGRASLRQCTPYQERRATEAQRAAAVDALTGLSTYRVLRDRLAYEVERSKRSAEGFAVLFLDLDCFKLVNDQYGHEAGNDILRAVAGEITKAVRASDVAARYGGDEFVVILTRTDLHGAARVAEVLRSGVEEAGRRMGYPPGSITVSIGLAEFDPRHPSDGDLLVSADRALYRAKAAGRNAVA